MRVGARGFESLLAWGRALDGERVWALEDCRHVSGALERFLIARGERVIRIPTNLMAGERPGGRARNELRRMRELSGRIDTLESEIAQLVAQIAPQLLSEPASGR